jgi:bifunctional DNA-binding transcriptional regulator/antitoxin component of YhaV-PrlF toxin-antitoxin module
MKTTLNSDGLMNIPKEFRDQDQLVAGDAFEIRRVGSGQYILAKQAKMLKPVTFTMGDDGLPIIRGEGVITSEMVREIEGKTA